MGERVVWPKVRWRWGVGTALAASLLPSSAAPSPLSPVPSPPSLTMHAQASIHSPLNRSNNPVHPFLLPSTTTQRIIMAVIDPNADGDGGSPHMEGPTITRQGVEARIKDLLAAGVKERYR